MSLNQGVAETREQQKQDHPSVIYFGQDEFALDTRGGDVLCLSLLLIFQWVETRA
eukprot:m.76169 g.76169  ORF g.76169 m.76169 type:complete len:55 (-) comp20579_c0_seq5:73-237(-)